MEVQTLIDLGLTSLQARIYLALYQTGTSEAATISKVTKVARSDVYRTMYKLQQLVMAMYDKKEVFIYIEPTADLEESPALWSNNPSLLALAKDCF